MKNFDAIRPIFAGFMLATFGIIFFEAEIVFAQENSAPWIAITSAAQAGEGELSMGTIVGRSGSVNGSKNRVVIYAHTDRWYVQPYVSAPLTEINADGSWSAVIHLGYEYAAMLVESDYDPPATTISLPEIRGKILALHRIAAASTR